MEPQTLKTDTAPANPSPLPGEQGLWLKNFLEEHNIDTSSWGTGTFKSFNHLLEEIAAGESRLVSEGQSVCRLCTVLKVDVRYLKAGQEFQLFESRQVFTDGRIRRRPTPFAVWEKAKDGEDPDKAAERAIREELQVAGPLRLSLLSAGTTDEAPLDYPGIPSRLNTISYRVDLSDNQFRPEGYTEKQSDKTTYFRWRAIGQSISSLRSQLDSKGFTLSPFPFMRTFESFENSERVILYRCIKGCFDPQRSSHDWSLNPQHALEYANPDCEAVSTLLLAEVGKDELRQNIHYLSRRGEKISLKEPPAVEKIAVCPLGEGSLFSYDLLRSLRFAVRLGLNPDNDCERLFGASINPADLKFKSNLPEWCMGVEVAMGSILPFALPAEVLSNYKNRHP